MRIGTSSFNDAQLNAMARLSTEIATDQSAVSTGKRRTAPSDDPAAAARSATLARAQANNAQYSAGLDLAEQRLNIADKSLAGVSDALIRVKELALQASSETSSPADLATYATEAKQILSSMVSLGNAQDGEGAYIFAGARDSQPAFAQDPTTGMVTYKGLAEAAPTSIGESSTLASTHSATALFGAIQGAGGRSAFAVVQDLISTLEGTPSPVPPIPAPTATLPVPPLPVDPIDPAVAARRTALAAAVDGATAAGDRIADTRADRGGALNRVDAERERLTAVGTSLTTARSVLDDTDLATTITNLQRASTILEATQKTFAQVSSLSLFSLLH